MSYTNSEDLTRVEFGRYNYQVYRNYSGEFSTIPNNARLEAILNGKVDEPLRDDDNRDAT